MKLSIIIPVYNEERTLKEIVRRIETVNLINSLSKEIIIIDDGSVDNTSVILNQMNGGGYKVIRHKVNQGKGKSVIDGLKRATGDIVVIQDADLEYDPEDYNEMLPPILSGKADVVYGSRLSTTRPHRVMYFWHYLGNKFLTFFSNIFTNLNLTDMEVGYKMFSKEVNDAIKGKLTAKRFGIEPEITALVKKHRVYEVGISYAGRTYQEGKKIGWKDGVSAIYGILKFNLLNRVYDKTVAMLLASFVAIIIINYFILPPTVLGDAFSYLKSMEVLKTGTVPDNFAPNRILTTYLGMNAILFVAKLTGNILTAWTIVNGLLFVLANIFFYLLLRNFLRSYNGASASFPAIMGALFFATNYAMLAKGLNYTMDIGGWAFYVFSLYFSFRYVESTKTKYYILSGAMVGAGLFFKEYAVLGFVVIIGAIFYKNWGLWKKMPSKILVVSAVSFLPILILYLSVYLKYDYSYLNWLQFNDNKFGSHYSSRFLEYIKAFGSLYNFGWFMFVGGIYYLVRQGRKIINNNHLVFFGLVALSGLMVFAWPAITQRILFVAIPSVILISSIFISAYKKRSVIIVLFCLYLLASYTMDYYILPLTNVDYFFNKINFLVSWLL